MGVVAGDLSLVTNYIPAVFPNQLAPGISITDHLLNLNAGNTFQMGGVKVDPTAKCAYAHPIFVPHNQLHTGPYTGTLPYIVYNNIAYDVDTTFTVGLAEPGGFQELVFEHDSATEGFAYMYANAPMGALFNAPAQGVTMLWRRKVTDGAAGTSFLAFRFVIQDGPYIYLFSVSTGVNNVPAIAVSLDAGITWNLIDPGARPEGSLGDYLGNTGPDQYQAVEILLMNFTVMVFMGGRATPFVIPINWISSSNPVLLDVSFKAEHFTKLNLSIHPTKWGTEDVIKSALINMGFSPPSAPSYRIHGLASAVLRADGVPWNVSFPAGSALTVSRGLLIGPNDQNQAYDLAITNPVSGTYRGEDYADLTAAATRVAIVSPPAWLGTNPIWDFPLELAAFAQGLKEVRESISLDLNSLCVAHRLSFVLDNFYGNRSGLEGNKAVNFRLGYLQPFLALQQRFLGYSTRYEYSRDGEGPQYVRVYCQDCMLKLEKKYNLSPPDLDGWNHYAAVAYLAQLGGIHATQMSDFLRLRVAVEGGGTLFTTPNGIIDPFSYTGADASPYFLPLGLGMHPWTPKNRAMSIRALMDFVRTATCYMLYFDAAGYLRYEPWIPPGAVPAAKKEFFEGGSGVDGADLSEFWAFGASSDTDNVRNQIVVIGVDAFGGSWAPIVTKFEDTDSISNPLVANYLSWESPFVLTDPKFASPAFAAEAALRMLQFMRVPDYEVSFETWMQPTIFPMDVVYVREAKSGVGLLPFYVTGIDTTYTVLGGALRMRSSIRGKYITPF